MTFDDFVSLLATEPDRSFERDVSVPAPELLADVRSRGGMSIKAFFADPRRTTERRIFREGHLLDPPLTPEELASWNAGWPAHRLPADLVTLLQRANGIHLRADLDRERGYQGLAPLREWRPARMAMWGEHGDPSVLADRYLAISYHDDAATFVVLDVESGRYFLMDSCGPDETFPIGTTAGELLDWLWKHR